MSEKITCPAKIGENGEPFEEGSLLENMCMKECFVAAMRKSRKKGAVTHPTTVEEIAERRNQSVDEMPFTEDKTVIRRAGTATRLMVRERGYDPFEQIGDGDTPHKVNPQREDVAAVETTHLTKIEFECPNE